jgi:hypothetical protein
MWEATEGLEIAAPPERAFTIVVDVARHTQLAGSGEVRTIRLDEPLAVGVEWEADIGVPEVGEPFKSRSQVLVLDAPREFRWSSVPLVRDNADELPFVTWWFGLTASDGGTVVEHGCRVDAPKIGADEFQTFFLERANRPPTILAGMRKTLQNLKAQAES